MDLAPTSFVGLGGLNAMQRVAQAEKAMEAKVSAEESK